MKALVYYKPGHISWEERPDPAIKDPGDVIVRIDAATVCGTDLHITQGVHPEVSPGTVLGHEGVGTITEVGEAVTKFKVGDRVVIPPITSCGKCDLCQKGLSAHCQTLGENGWQLGHMIDGLQADFARVPFADHSIHLAPEGLSNEELIMSVDVLASAYEMGVLNGRVSEGDTVVIIGDGPVGLGAVITAQLLHPAVIIAVGIQDFRLDIAKSLGATHVVNSTHEDWIEKVRALCPKGGADVVIEAVGKVETLEAAFALINTLGRIANIGVHSEPVSMPIEKLWIKGFTFTSGLVSCSCVPHLLDLQASGKIAASSMVSHRFKFEETVQAYECFTEAEKTKATKIIIQR